uniref:Transposase n=1 Tax=Ascaris lumbricoides TaxID=6252 RepID=A0A0M3IBG5_ASCLU
MDVIWAVDESSYDGTLCHCSKKEASGSNGSNHESGIAVGPTAKEMQMNFSGMPKSDVNARDMSAPGIETLGLHSA